MSMYILKTSVENNSDFTDTYTLYATTPSPIPEKCSLIPVDDSNFYLNKSISENVDNCQQAKEAAIEPVLFVDVTNNHVFITKNFSADKSNQTIETQTVELNKAQFPNGVKDLLGMINL